jgi:hypothetical protein
VNDEPKRKRSFAISLFIIIIAIIGVGLLSEPLTRLGAWLITMALLALFTTVAGRGITGEWGGLLIDERNKMSLSRFQMIVWTITVLSAFLVAALSNIALGDTYPLYIEIPDQLWILMGISVTSLVGAPLIISTKKAKHAKETEKSGTFELIKEQRGLKDGIDNKGLVVVNLKIKYASWSDLFKGDEVGNAAYLDLGKVQMFFFTLIVALAYAVALGAMFTGPDRTISEFPLLDTSIVALIGISHAGYLANKATPHSQAA